MGERPEDHDEIKKRKDGKAKRRKVSHACLYCRRSHMTCDDTRPCQRCIKRDIGHLCHDEPKTKTQTENESAPVEDESIVSELHQQAEPAFDFPLTDPSGASTWPLIFPQETSGNEFSVLSDFLESLEDQSFFNGGFNSFPENGVNTAPLLPSVSNTYSAFSPAASSAIIQSASESPTVHLPSPEASLRQSQHLHQQPSEHIEVLPTATKAERFLLTAADQEDGTRDERLARVIHAKYEAGLLKPFNYVKGYARLSRWMDMNVSPQSKQQILQLLSILRPKFRAIAQSLTDIDLVFIEEAFERLLLNYDRVFSAMGIPACLWRRTGEIYKGNKEFADLVGVEVSQLREGRLCIYELMSEESAVNYWEKYGHIAFDAAQKAVLTSCVLRYKPLFTSLSNATSGASTGLPGASPVASWQQQQGKRRRNAIAFQEGFINCCFSFTIQRDLHGIPSLIAGNFIRH